MTHENLSLTFMFKHMHKLSEAKKNYDENYQHMNAAIYSTKGKGKLKPLLDTFTGITE